MAPMPFTYAALADWTGRRVTSACQTLVGGRLGQPRSEVPAGGGELGAGLDGAALEGAGPIDGSLLGAASTNRVDGDRPGEQAVSASTAVASTIQRRIDVA